MLKYKILIYLKFLSYNLVPIIIIPLLFCMLSYNTPFNTDHDNNGDSSHFLQNSYAIEIADDKDKVNTQEEKDDNQDSKETDDDDESDNNNNKEKSIFNFVAVGDWDCTGETEDTVKNIINQDPELVLALGDFSYSGDADCWFDLIEPIADKTKIVIGNHEVDSDKLTEDYMNYFGLQEQYYSFIYKNMHFLALSTETDYDDDSEQYKFAIQES